MAGASEDAKWGGPSAGNAPTERSTSFPSQTPAPPRALSQPRGCPEDLLCWVRNPRGVPLALGGTGRERGSSRPEQWAGVRSQVRAGRRARGWWLRGDPGPPAAPGACGAGTCLPRQESVTRPGISSDRRVCPGFPGQGETSASPGPGAQGPRPRSGRLAPRYRGRLL